MAVEIELARNAVLKAAWLKDHEREFATAAAMAKLFSGEVSRRAANAAVQIHGGYGFMTSIRCRGIGATARSMRSAKARTRCSGW